AHVGRARAEHQRRLDAARDRQVRAHPAPRGPEPQHVARVHAEALPGGYRGAVHGGGHVRAGERDEPLVGEFQARADQGAFEPGHGVGIADQAIGEQEGLAVHRARGRDAHAEVTDAAQILDGGERTRVLDEELAHRVAMPGPSMRGRYRPASTSATMASYSARSIAWKRT